MEISNVECKFKAITVQKKNEKQIQKIEKKKLFHIYLYK